MSDDYATLGAIAATAVGRLRMRHALGEFDSASIVDRARIIATAVHAGQVDKAGRRYIDHPYRVHVALVGQGADDVTVAAGWLHDAVEDTDLTVTDIAVLLGAEGPAVAAVVAALTHRPHEPLTQYWARVRRNPRAVAVKVADLDDNTDPDRLASLDEPTRTRLTAKYARARAALTTGGIR